MGEAGRKYVLEKFDRRKISVRLWEALVRITKQQGS